MKVGPIIADGFICINYNDDPKIFLVEVENSKYFTTSKYIDFKESFAYKEKFPIMPSIIVITDKKIKYDDRLDIIHLNTDLSNMENLLIKL